MRGGPTEADAESRSPPRGLGLSARLLVLTIVFVLLAEVLIYVPSVANFRGATGSPTASRRRRSPPWC